MYNLAGSFPYAGGWALTLDPDSLEAMHGLAIAEERHGEDASAGSRLDEILKRNPHFLPALDEQMQVAVARRDFPTALSPGLQKDPYRYACHFEPGELYQRTGHFPLARDDFEWVVRFFPAADATVFRSLAQAAKCRGSLAPVIPDARGRLCGHRGLRLR